MLTIKGKNYALLGDPVFQGVTEFVSAIRQGAATNDDRNLGNFFSFEDARRGIGVQVGSIREDFDVLADHDGVVTQQMNQMVKPFKMEQQDLSLILTGGRAVFLETKIGARVHLFMGMGPRMFYGPYMTSPEMVQTTEAPFTDGQVTSIMAYTQPVGGERGVFVAGLAEDGSDQNLRYTEDPFALDTFETVAKAGHMLFEFDGKFFLGGHGVLYWTIDPLAVSPTWTTLSATGAFPHRWKFVGIFPVGDTFMPHVLTDPDDPHSAQLAIVDVDNNKVIPLGLGLAGVVDAYPAAGGIGIIHNHGRDLSIYEPARSDLRNSDWRAQTRGGFVAERDATILSGVSGRTDQYLLAQLTNSNYTQLFASRGGSWVPYGRQVGGTAIRGLHYSPQYNRLMFSTTGSLAV